MTLLGGYSLFYIKEIQNKSLKILRTDTDSRGKEVGVHFAITKVGYSQQIMKVAFYNVSSIQYRISAGNAGYFRQQQYKYECLAKLFELCRKRYTRASSSCLKIYHNLYNLPLFWVFRLLQFALFHDGYCLSLFVTFQSIQSIRQNTSTFSYSTLTLTLCCARSKSHV